MYQIARIHSFWLIAARSRLFVAVTLPAVIGLSIAVREINRIPFHFTFLILTGLILVEMSSMLAWDYNYLKKGLQKEGNLPGNPLFPTLSLTQIQLLSILFVLISVGIFIFFLTHKGVPMLLFLIPAVLAGVLYAVPCIPGNFFATAIIPPFIACGAQFAAGGKLSLSTFITALPLAFSAAFVIAGYRCAIPAVSRKKYRWVQLITLLAMITYFSLLVMSGVGFLVVNPWLNLIAIIASTVSIYKSARSNDPVPFTSFAVAAHSIIGLEIILAIPG